MTREELEKLAIGIETGYTDRNGTPIKVGDEIVIYNRSTEFVGAEKIEELPDFCIVGTGAQGYAYTGKVQRQKHHVKFTFRNGLEMAQRGKYKFLEERDSQGNLRFVLVNNDGKAPKMTFDELMKEEIEKYY